MLVWFIRDGGRTVGETLLGGGILDHHVQQRTGGQCTEICKCENCQVIIAHSHTSDYIILVYIYRHIKVEVGGKYCSSLRMEVELLESLY